MLIPIRAKNPPESFPYATIALISVNVLAFAITVGGDGFIRAGVVKQFADISNHHGVFRSLASMFLHANIFYQIFETLHDVGHFAHIGGLLGGALICWLMQAERDSHLVAKLKGELADFRDMGILSAEAVDEMVGAGDLTLILKYTRWAMET